MKYQDNDVFKKFILKYNRNVSTLLDCRETGMASGCLIRWIPGSEMVGEVPSRQFDKLQDFFEDTGFFVMLPVELC